MLKWIALENSVLLAESMFAFCCVIFIVLAVSHINNQNELKKEIKELRADVEELYLRVDNFK